MTAVGKEPICNARDDLQCRRPGFDPWVGKIPWRRKWQPTPVFMPGESHGQRSQVGYRPWGCKESDTTERLHFHSFTLQIAEKRREAKGKGEKERYTYLNAEFQRIARRDKKAFLSDQCKEIEENNRMGRTRDLFKKIRDTREHFMQRWAQ